MVEMFCAGGELDFIDRMPTALGLLSGPPSCGKTSLLFQFALNVILHKANEHANRDVVFICKRSKINSNPPCLPQGIDSSSKCLQKIQMKYFEDDDGIMKYFAAFHMHDTLPLAVIVDDFGELFSERNCQERFSSARGRDIAMVRVLALCHNAMVYAKGKGGCRLLLSDTHVGDSPRLLFLYKRWTSSIFTIKGNELGSFLLSCNLSPEKIAKYTFTHHYVLLEEIIEDRDVNKNI